MLLLSISYLGDPRLFVLWVSDAYVLSALVERSVVGCYEANAVCYECAAVGTCGATWTSGHELDAGESVRECSDGSAYVSVSVVLEGKL